MIITELPDELITVCFSFLDVPNLARISYTNHRMNGIIRSQSEHLWKALLLRDWLSFPRYRSDRRDYGVSLSSKEAYRFIFEDVQRKQIREDEMTQLNWYFNYHPLVGGQGWSTVRRCHFTSSVNNNNNNNNVQENNQLLKLLHVEGYPPLPWELLENGTILRVSDFPNHPIVRLGDGEWLIYNDFVTLVSCDQFGTLNYRGRAFQLGREPGQPGLSFTTTATTTTTAT